MNFTDAPLGDVYHTLKNRFCKKIEISSKDLVEIICFVLGSSKEDFYFSFDRVVSKEQYEKIFSFCERKNSGEPLSYILGYVDFYDCKIKVTSDVLIPRVETELLVEKVLEKIKEKTHSVILDLCTGSGCIGVCLKKHFPSSTVFLSDVSKKALSVAKENAQINNVSVLFLEGDFLEPFKDKKILADVIVCNPPYISNKEYHELNFSVRGYEPKVALTDEKEGILFYERLARDASVVLKRGGLIALEIGASQKDKVKKIFSCSSFKHFLCEKDYAGHDRFIFLELE
jgi:release factor glutamine methyltransferase